jgi:hypothetical protein
MYLSRCFNIQNALKICNNVAVVVAYSEIIMPLQISGWISFLIPVIFRSFILHILLLVTYFLINFRHSLDVKKQNALFSDHVRSSGRVLDLNGERTFMKIFTNSLEGVNLVKSAQWKPTLLKGVDKLLPYLPCLLTDSVEIRCSKSSPKFTKKLWISRKPI